MLDRVGTLPISAMARLDTHSIISYYSGHVQFTCSVGVWSYLNTDTWGVCCWTITFWIDTGIIFCHMQFLFQWEC